MYAVIVRTIGRHSTPSVDGGLSSEGRDLVGPLHRVAGRYVWSSLPSLFGDYATACGLTLPLYRTHSSTEPDWLRSPSKCGDCFPLTQGGSH